MTATPMIVSADRLATFVGLTPRRLSQLVAEGVLVRQPGGFDLEVGVRRYCDWLRRDEATATERRALLRAQTAATQARASRHLGASFTRDEIVSRLREPIASLWDVRSAVSWHRTRLKALDVLPADVLDQVCLKLHAELNALLAQARDRFEGAFPPPADTNAAEPAEAPDA